MAIEWKDGVVAPSLYSIGVDLGDARDPTAIIILERPLWIGDEESRWRLMSKFVGGEDNTWASPDSLNAYDAFHLSYLNIVLGRPAFPVFRVRHIERLPLGGGYPRAVARVSELYGRLSKYEPEVIVDHTGVGRPVIQYFRNAGIDPLGIHLHAGADHRYIAHEHRYNVGVREIVAATQILFENKRIQVAADLPYADALKKELLSFRRKINPQTAHESFSAWRENQWDDLVFALSMCAWRQADFMEPMETTVQDAYYRRFATNVFHDDAERKPARRTEMYRP